MNRSHSSGVCRYQLIASAWRWPLSTDICRPHPSSAANQLHVAVVVNRRDRERDKWTDWHPTITQMLTAYYASSVKRGSTVVQRWSTGKVIKLRLRFVQLWFFCNNNGRMLNNYVKNALQRSANRTTSAEILCYMFFFLFICKHITAIIWYTKNDAKSLHNFPLAYYCILYHIRDTATHWSKSQVVLQHIHCQSK